MNSPNGNPAFTATCNNCGCFVQGRSQQCPYCGGSVTRTAPAEERREPSFDRREPGFDRKEPVFGEPAAAAVPPPGPTQARPRGNTATDGSASPFPQSAPEFLATPAGGYGSGAQAAYPVGERRRSGLSAILALAVFAVAFAVMVVVVRQANRAPDDDTASTRSATGELASQQNPAVPDASQNAPQVPMQAPMQAPSQAQGAQPSAPSPDAVTTAGAPPSPPVQTPQQASPSSTVPAAPAIAQQPAAPTPAPSTQPVAPAPYRHARTANHTAHSDWTAPSIAAIEPPPAATPQSPRASGSARSDLAAARSDLEESNLEGARAALNRALSEDPSNGRALALQEHLASRERARDAALSIARDCLAHQAWKCAWHNAGNALSIDSSSEEASSIVQRSQVDWGQSNQAAGQEAN